GGDSVETGEEAVASAGDVASGSDRCAGSAGDGDEGALVEIGVGTAESGSCAETVFGAGGGRLGACDHAEVDDCAVGIVIDEVLVTVTAGADGGTKALVDEALEGFGDVVGVIAEGDAAGAVGCSSGEAAVLAVAEAVEADVAGVDDLNSHRGSLCRS